MRFLFIHQNFPGQFKHWAPALVARGHEVVALAIRAGETISWSGVRVVPYQVQRGSSKDIHPWLIDFEAKTLRGEACLRACLKLRDEGFVPDVVVAHPGWGESLFVKEVWPKTKVVMYCEYFYGSDGADVGFDPEFPADDPVGSACRLRLKNANYFMHFDQVEYGLSPTLWQADTFPAPFRGKIKVVHDGIDTDRVVPSSKARITVQRGIERFPMAHGDEVITFVNRNLEPYRGYHIFMRALPAILAARPLARVLIVGADDVSYGARSPDGRKWKQVFIEEVKPQIPSADWERVHFLGAVPYETFVNLLQVSAVHVYLTYPFVLSWSLLEAMSAGCSIVASSTPPVCEVITHGVTGRLVGFSDVDALAQEVIALLQDRKSARQLGRAARATVVQRYDLKTVCLPQQIAWVEGMVAR